MEGGRAGVRRLTAFAIALCLLAVPAAAAPEEGEIVTSILVNYGSAYKDQTWAPVDVVVKNDKRDVKGWLEVRTYAGETLQSPIYRQPVELPKNSRKRFQFHCYFNGTSGLAVQLYDGRLPVFEFPHELPGLRPIAEGDLLSLVLDDEGSGFSFLYMALNPHGGNRGVHRETVDTTELAFLSEHPQSYEPLDFVVMGDIDPEQIAPRVRELLREYVRRGGVLAVCTGSHAVKYRGSWVEELAGVAIGPEAAVDEAALARKVFPEEGQKGARAGRECMVAALEAKAPEARPVGAARTLAVKRPLGSGLVYTLAVDADSRALQETEGYAELWREIRAPRQGVSGLNFTAAADFAVEALPRVSGIVIHSKSSVIAYLALYFVVAIVGNWLFFSWLKRREWAWAALVVFAIGFTAYAMIYGTTGRARSSELHQLQVVRVPSGGGLSAIDSFVGILTAHTAEYAMAIDHPAPLAEDLYFRWFSRSAGMPGFGRGLGAGSRPFTFVQGAAPRIEGFRIGASELRLARVTHGTELGGLEGTLVFDDEGLRGELVNKTGLVLTDPFLFFRGRRYTLAIEGDRFRVDIPTALIVKQPPVQVAQPGMNPFNYPSSRYGGRTGPLPASQLRRQFPDHLLVADAPEGFAPGGPGGMMYVNQPMPVREDLGPFVCGWSEGRHFPVVKPDTPLRPNLNETLVVADVAVEYRSDPGAIIAFSDIQEKAANRSPEMENVTVHDLPGLEQQVSALVRENPGHPAVSDLIGSFSQLVERYGLYRPAADLALDWGVRGPEAEEAALWDRMIERWWISDPFPLPGGWMSMLDPLPPPVPAIMTGDLTPVMNGLIRGQTYDDDRILGFVFPDRLYAARGQAMPRGQGLGMAGPLGALGGRRGGGPGMNMTGCYLMTELWSPDERTVGFAHGSDDWVRIFINGMEFYRNAEGRDAEPNQDRFSARLHAGRNVVFIVFGNEVGEWEMSLAFEEGGEGVEVRLPGSSGAPSGPEASARFDDLRRWAVERTDRLDELMRQVQAEVQRNPEDEAVSDLIGNLSQLTQRLGQHRPAMALATEWGVTGKERDDAALWDRMIERWYLTPAEPVGGRTGMESPLSPAMQSVAEGRVTPEADPEQGWLLVEPPEVTGFVHLDRIQAARMGPVPFPPGRHDMAMKRCHALAELWSPDERVVTLLHGSDDWSRVFVNGREVHRNMAVRDAAPDQDRFVAPLHAGRNVVLVVCGNKDGRWEFSLAIESGGEGVTTQRPEAEQGRP